MKALFGLAWLLHRLRYALTMIQILVTLVISANIGVALFSGITALVLIKGFYWIIGGIYKFNQEKYDESS